MHERTGVSLVFGAQHPQGISSRRREFRHDLTSVAWDNLAELVEFIEEFIFYW